MLSADEGIGDIPAMISTTDEGIDEIQQCYLPMRALVTYQQ